jgi:hypothetical protein
MDPQLKAQLRQTVYFSVSSATVDQYGQLQAFSTATAVSARVQPYTKEVALSNGDIVKTTHMVIMSETAVTPTFETRLYLPGDPVTLPFARRTRQIHPCYDEFGDLDHWEVVV